MKTSYFTRFAGLLVAGLMTVAINGAMLWQFDTVAQEAVAQQTPTLATLESVNVVARKV